MSFKTGDSVLIKNPLGPKYYEQATIISHRDFVTCPRQYFVRLHDGRHGWYTEDQIRPFEYKFKPGQKVTVKNTGTIGEVVNIVIDHVRQTQISYDVYFHNTVLGDCGVSKLFREDELSAELPEPAVHANTVSISLDSGEHGWRVKEALIAVLEALGDPEGEDVDIVEDLILRISEAIS